MFRKENQKDLKTAVIGKCFKEAVTIGANEVAKTGDTVRDIAQDGARFGKEELRQWSQLGREVTGRSVGTVDDGIRGSARFIHEKVSIISAMMTVGSVSFGALFSGFYFSTLENRNMEAFFLNSIGIGTLGVAAMFSVGYLRATFRQVDRTLPHGQGSALEGMDQARNDPAKSQVQYSDQNLEGGSQTQDPAEHSDVESSDDLRQTGRVDAELNQKTLFQILDEGSRLRENRKRSKQTS